MDLAVSTAYTRGLLVGKPTTLKDSGTITRDECITFLDACVALMDLEETTTKLREEFKRAKHGTQKVVDGVLRSDGMTGIRLGKGGGGAKDGWSEATAKALYRIHN